MIPLSLAEVAAATGGRLSPDADPHVEVKGSVEFDSRRVGRGGLFVALVGERVDGHDYAQAAVAAGAVAMLAARSVGVPAVIVADVPAALGRLAGAVLSRLPLVTVVGITGSAGKTTTKDLLARLLRELGPTVAPPESFNNEIGHPYTVLQADGDTRFLILEVSARSIGNVAALCAIAPPRIGAVLNVGSAHIGVFGSRAAIATAKGELVEALPTGGVAVLNADDPLVAAMRSRTAARVVTVGRGGLDAGHDVGSPSAEQPDLRAEEVSVGASGRPAYTLVTRDGQRAEVALRLRGEHQVTNSLAAAAVAWTLGLPLPRIAAVLSASDPASRWRMEVTDRADGVTVINDAYNANPESMRAALRTLVTMARGHRAGAAQACGPAGLDPVPRRNGRAWAVLGPMAELGEDRVEQHLAIGRFAGEVGADRILVVGSDAAPILAGFEQVRPGGARLVADVAAAQVALRDAVLPGDVVLVKASRVSGLERVAAGLLTAGPPRDASATDSAAESAGAAATSDTEPGSSGTVR